MTPNGANDPRRASLLRAIMNEIKRDEAAAARELSLDLSVVRSALAGASADLDQVLCAAVAHWPISPFALQAMPAVAKTGALIMTEAQSAATSRVICRSKRPYYEYRDTAQSGASPIRPEWIRMLVDSDGNPDSPHLQWNSGHALHQLTWFLGPVHFFWEEGGRRHVALMEAGDTAYIPSWIPHTFTRFAEADLSAIIAVTFRSAVTHEAAADLTTYARLQAARTPLARISADAAMSPAMLAHCAGLSEARVSALMAGKSEAEPMEQEQLAAALEVPVHAILRSMPTPAVVLQRTNERGEVRGDGFGRAVIADNPVIRPARGVVLIIDSGTHVNLPAPDLHQYVFVLPGGAVRLEWAGEARDLRPGDSACLAPGLEHRWQGADRSAAKLLSFRCPGALGAAARAELDWLGAEAWSRYAEKQVRWYA